MREVMQTHIVRKPAQFIHHDEDPLGVCSLGVENGLGGVEDYQNLFGGKEGSDDFQRLHQWPWKAGRRNELTESGTDRDL